MKKIVFALPLLALVAGCSGSVVDTDTRPWTSNDSQHPQQVLGYYSLPRAYYSVEIKCDSGDLTATVGDAVYVPDTSQPLYAIRYNTDAWMPGSRSGFSNDTINIQVDKSGLLAGATSTAVNQTGNIVGAAATLLTQVGVQPLIESLAILKKNTSSSTKTYCASPTDKYDVKTTIDPAAYVTNGKLGGGGSPAIEGTSDLGTHKITLSAVRIGEAGAPALANPQSMDACDHAGGSANLCHGLYFRPPAAYAITVTVIRSGEGTPANCPGCSITKQTFVVFPPDPMRVFYIPFDRRVFTQFNVQLGFDHGMLTKFQSTDDSEVLGVLQLPATIIKDVLGIGSSGGGSGGGSGDGGTGSSGAGSH
jgi:hypothetical protein